MMRIGKKAYGAMGRISRGPLSPGGIFAKGVVALLLAAFVLLQQSGMFDRYDDPNGVSDATASPSGASETRRAVAATLVRVVDGDTVAVSFNDGKKDESVRLIGIDTPESRKNRRAELQAGESGKTTDAILAMGCGTVR